MIKKILISLLFLLPVYLSISLYFLDKEYFLCPVRYKRDIIIRNDARGEGVFAASRGGGRRMHNGVDLYGQVGEPVYAVRSGIVTSAKQNNGMGKYIVIKHSDNLSTLYGHLSAIYVSNNDSIRQGEVIGAIGKTGNANYRDIQPHLHFEVREDNIPVDPMDYLD